MNFLTLIGMAAALIVGWFAGMQTCMWLLTESGMINKQNGQSFIGAMRKLRERRNQP